jgi:hypothetical protein
MGSVAIAALVIGRVAASPVRPGSGEEPAVRDTQAASSARGVVGASGATGSTADGTTRARVVEAYGKLPLSFEPNVGQLTGSAARGAQFVSRGKGYTLGLNPREAIVSLYGVGRLAPQTRAGRKQLIQRGVPRAIRATEVVDIKLVGSRAAGSAIGLDELPGKVNYFRGRDPRNWRTNIPTYAKIELGQVYPGIDLVYYGNQQHLEYDFVVEPGSDPRKIRMDVKRLSAGNSIRTVAPQLDRNGDLVVAADGGDVRFRKPVVYQPGVDPRDASSRKPIDGSFKLDRGQVMFQVASYDHHKPLIIDPVLAYSTYINSTSVD